VQSLIQDLDQAEASRDLAELRTLGPRAPAGRRQLRHLQQLRPGHRLRAAARHPWRRALHPLPDAVRKTHGTTVRTTL
jgi:hypothetical protein